MEIEWSLLNLSRGAPPLLLWFWHNNRSAEEEERHTRVDTGADEDCYGKAAGKGERGEEGERAG